MCERFWRDSITVDVLITASGESFKASESVHFSSCSNFAVEVIVEKIAVKKDGTVVPRKKERASVVYERKSREGQNRAGTGRVLQKGERRSLQKGQKSAESRALRFLSAVGATGVPVARALEHRGRWMRG